MISTVQVSPAVSGWTDFSRLIDVSTWSQQLSLDQDSVEIRFTDNFRMVVKKSRAMKVELYDRVIVDTAKGAFIGTVLTVCNKPSCKKERKMQKTEAQIGGRILRKATQQDLQKWLMMRKLNRGLSPASTHHQNR